MFRESCCIVVVAVVAAVFVGMVLSVSFRTVAFAADEAFVLERAEFSWPTVEVPFYHAVLSAVGAPGGKVDEVKVDGVAVPFTVREAGSGTLVTVRLNWVSGREYEFAVTGGGGEAVLLATAPAQGGYWREEWKGCQAVVLTETEGLERKNEPVEVGLTAYLDEEPKVSDWGKEVRVFSLNSGTGELAEVPRQVYEESAVTGLVGNPNAKGTTLCRVLFLADVPAKATRLYLIYYGNASAEKPEYSSDLSVEKDVPLPDYCHLEWNPREGQDPCNFAVENSFYRILTHPRGQIYDIILKETGLHVPHMEGLRHVIDWNPDILTHAPKSVWSGIAFEGFVPELEVAEGPVMFMVRRHGELRDFPGVHIATTYRFYADNPYFMKESTIFFSESLPVCFLRNDEFAFPPDVFTHFFWKNQSGQVVSTPQKEEGEDDMVLPTETPWLGMFNPEAHGGMASLRLLFSTLGPNNTGAPLVNSATHLSLAGYVDYWHRVLIWTSGGGHALVPEGSLYTERNAYLLFEPGPEGEDQFKPVGEWYARLTHPLVAVPTEGW